MRNSCVVIVAVLVDNRPAAVDSGQQQSEGLRAFAQRAIEKRRIAHIADHSSQLKQLFSNIVHIEAHSHLVIVGLRVLSYIYCIRLELVKIAVLAGQ